MPRLWRNEARSEGHTLKFVAEDALISDQRVARVEGLLRMKYANLPADARLFTYVQPPDGDRQRVAVFVVASPDPKGRELAVMTPGSIWYADWQKRSWAYEHLVGIPDPAIEAFEQVVREHIKSVKRIKRNN